MERPLVDMKIKNGKNIKIQLYPDKAPEAVKNFIMLAEKGFFNGLFFWRVEKGVLIQSGCPDNDGTGTLGYSIKSECKENGVNNDLKFIKGTLGLGRFELNTECSEFFITVINSPQLDEKFTAFGRVIDGMDEVERISNVQCEKIIFFHKAIEKVYIEKITINTFGKKYGMPEKLPGFTKEEMIKKNYEIINQRSKNGIKLV
ncbi:peptidylprolyl isomerase [Clostridium senegalense]|uniref:peptidylprolyl isomerase n=1 Tax=Clostridium senegalense TaxID=1465809 RepID=UPI00028869FC|nr:peptidylprolyl isomerase [Clostridium senegalense]